MVAKRKINEIGEELNKIESNLINNVIPKLEEFGESSRRNAHFMRPMYVPVGCTTNFSFGFDPRKVTSLIEINLTPISQMAYFFNIDGACN